MMRAVVGRGASIWLGVSLIADPVLHPAGACGEPASRERHAERVLDGGREDGTLPNPELFALRSLEGVAVEPASGCGPPCPTDPGVAAGHALVFDHLPSEVLAVQPITGGPARYHVAARLEDGRFEFHFDGDFFEREEFVVWGLDDEGRRTPALAIEPVVLVVGEPTGGPDQPGG